jgi:hypothetical protein
VDRHTAVQHILVDGPEAVHDMPDLVLGVGNDLADRR